MATFEEFIDKANWNADTQAGVLYEFIKEHALKYALDAWLTEKYGHELESDEVDDDG